MFFRSVPQAPRRTSLPIPSPIMSEMMLDMFVGADRYTAPDEVSVMQLRHALQRLNEAISIAPDDRQAQVAASCARRLARHIDQIASDLLLSM